MGIITCCWLLGIPIAILSVMRFVKNRNIFIGDDLRRIRNDPTIIFQITTRSATKTPVVKRGIDSITRSCAKIKYVKYKISIVTDDLHDVDSLHGENCDVIVVNRKFTTNAIKKGRALQYAVNSRREENKNTSSYWVFHMDDESYVTHQTVLSLLKFIRDGSAIVSEGPIFYPLKFESANIFTALAESIRPFTCYDCVSQMTNDVVIKSPPLHMHGSNLLIRSDIEDSIGWNFGPTLAEDQMFGYKVYEKYGPKSLGWHGGILLEQPPLNMKDHFMQRRRWVVGSLQNIDKFSSAHKIKMIYKLITYFLGFTAGFVSTILSFQFYLPVLLSIILSINQYSNGTSHNVASLIDSSINTIYSHFISHSWVGGGPLEIGVGLLLLFSSVVWLLSYQVGLLLNLRYSTISPQRKFVLHLQALILCPIIGLIETFPAFWAILEYNLKRKTNKRSGIPVYDFYVINK